MNKTLAVAVAVLMLCGCGNGIDEPVTSGDPLDGITKDRIYTHLAYLADDVLEGRLTGEPGFDMAAKYVSERFAEIGLEPGGDEGWYQQVPFQSYRVDTESVSMIVHRDSGDSELRYRDDYTMGADMVRSENSVRGELVYIGRAVHAPDYGYSDYGDIDVAGKILVGYSGGPDIIPGDERSFYSSSRTKYEEMIARGAVGYIGLRSRQSQANSPWERSKKAAGKKASMTWIDLSGAPDGYYPELRGKASLSPAAATALLGGTPISFEETLDAIEASTVASVPLGIEVTLARKSTHKQFSSPNVIGVIRGTDPELADEYIVYTAHLDHVGVGVEVDGDDIYNGMYDNAMGTAIMIETARALAAKPPRRSIMFIALVGEERGLLGSDYFAHYPTVPVDSIVANVNIDMPLFLYPLADIVAFGAEHSSLGAVADAAATAEGFVLTPDPIPEEGLFRRSDQYSFVRKGIPAIYLDPGFTSSDPDIDSEALRTDHRHSHYHRPSDDLSRPIDWDSAVRFTRANARIGSAIANDDARPTWNEGDFFGDKFAGGQ
jgi:hypothetical protein